MAQIVPFKNYSNSIAKYFLKKHVHKNVNINEQWMRFPNLLGWNDPRHTGVRGVMVIVVGNGHGDTSSNPGWNWLHFT